MAEPAGTRGTGGKGACDDRGGRRPEHRRGEAGSAWILAPAALLIMVVLGAIAVDSALVYLGQRQLVDAADSAATNAAGGISESAFYGSPTGGGGRIVLSANRADRLAAATISNQDLSAVTLSSTQVEVAGRQVCVRLSGVVHPIFGSALPGHPFDVGVTAVATATAASPGVALQHSSICPAPPGG